MTTKPPNILLIMADQLAPQYMGTYGHPQVQTPNIDAIAARGTRFDAAYCNSPLCAPSRFSFMSGQLITKIGAYDNACEFSSTIPTFAHYLRSAGYTTCLSGKMHFVGPDQLHGFEERITTDVYPSDYAWTPDWENADERIADWYHNMESVTDAGPVHASVQLDYDDEVAFFARRKLFDYARQQTEPFCLVASFTHPHDPYEAPQEFWDLYDHDSIELPKVNINRADQDPMSGRLMDGIEATTVTATEDQIRNARHGYFANISYFDSKVGELVKTLEQANLLDNTIVIVTADHGEMLGERNLWYKMSFFEQSARVPLVMAGPSIANGQIPNACSLVDILPTLVDIATPAEAEAPALGKQIDGHSLLPLAMGQADTRDVAISEYCAEMTAYPIYMIRRGKYKYIYCKTDPAQLFDLDADPDERHNLVADAQHATVAAAFAAEVKERWDCDALHAKVIASQHTRRAVATAMSHGKRTDWDFNPTRNASEEYVRNHISWVEAAVNKRYPPFEK